MMRSKTLTWLSLAFAGIVQAATPLVVVQEVRTGTVVEQIPVSGTVTSPRVSRLSPEVAGRVIEVLVDIGGQVEQGQPLLRLDPTMTQIELDMAAAATAQAREELADAQRRFKDAQRLRESRGIPETEYQSRRSEARADAALLDRREAEQRREQERLRRHELRAPFAGVISQKLTETGEWVAPGDEVLELVADWALRIDFQVPQAYFPRISQGTPLLVRLDALPGQSIPVKVQQVVPVSDPTARTFLLRTTPEADGLPLAPGMSASGKLRLDQVERRVVVTRDALLRHPDGRTSVWVLESAGEAAVAREQVVKTGLSFDGLVEIRDGLDAGARVVVEGNEALQHGQTVQVTGER